jgi:hypothetical protein
MKNFSGVIGVIVLVALIGVGVYYGWQQRDAHEYVSYTNKTYGFSFDYPKPLPPAQLTVSESGLNSDLLAEIAVRIPGNAYEINPIVLIWNENDLNKVVAKEKSSWPMLSANGSRVVNDISWTILKGHLEAVWDADYEIRIGKLPSGYVVELISGGWSQSSPNQASGPDQKFLDSFRSTNLNVS